MTDELNPLQRENAYYKKRIDVLSAQNLKLDVVLSDVRYALIQKQKGFALLSTLQQSAASTQDATSVLRLAIEAVSSTLSVERTVVLTPTGKDNHFVASQWRGYRDEEVAAIAGVELEFPPGFSTGTDLLLVNRGTPVSPLIESIQKALSLPFFVAVPVVVEESPLAIVISGRLRENRPLWPPFDEGDVHTFQSLAGFIAASIQILRVGALQETDRLKTVFFANISHEFRTPITLTIGPLQGLLTGRYGEISELVRKQADTMMRNQQRLLGLINQILDLAKAEAGEMQLKPALVRNFNELVDRTVMQFQSMAEGRGLELRTRFDPAIAQAEIYVDRDLFDKLLFNLLSNAHKFTKQGGVTVSTELLDREVRLSVTDTGIGIKSDQTAFIFDRFRQADGSSSREFAGTGIGLSLVKEIAALHKGDIRVTSEYGKGTTFRFTLPVGKAHLDASSIVEHGDSAADQAPLPKAVELREGGGRDEVAAANELTLKALDPQKALVVYADDNADLRSYVKDLLSPHYNVLLGADGEQGLEVSRAHRPALILSDLMMPKLTGTEFCKCVREDVDLRSTPFVLLTAKTSTDSRIEGLDDGADDYLNKPFVEQELLARVRNLIFLREQQGRLKEELRAARDIQRALLPPLTQQIPGTQLDALYHPCDELSGDFYDVFQSKGWIYVYLADVTSHGTVAAQVTYLVKGLFREELSRDSAPSLPTLIKSVTLNYASYNLEYDVGVQCLRYHPAERKLEYMRGNSPQAVMVRKGDPGMLQARPGQGLSRSANVETSEATVAELSAQPGDSFYLFTDGCVEFDHRDGKAFGLRRFVGLLGGLAEPWKKSLLDQLNAARADAFGDDVTVLRLKIPE